MTTTTAIARDITPLSPYTPPPNKPCWCGEVAAYAIAGTQCFYCAAHADDTQALYRSWVASGGESRFATAMAYLPRGLRRRLGYA